MNDDNVTCIDTFGAEHNIFQNKLKNLQATKISQKIFIEHEQMIQ